MLQVQLNEIDVYDTLRTFRVPSILIYTRFALPRIGPPTGNMSGTNPICFEVPLLAFVALRRL